MKQTSKKNAPVISEISESQRPALKPADLSIRSLVGVLNAFIISIIGTIAKVRQTEKGAFVSVLYRWVSAVGDKVAYAEIDCFCSQFPGFDAVGNSCRIDCNKGDDGSLIARNGIELTDNLRLTDAEFGRLHDWLNERPLYRAICEIGAIRWTKTGHALLDVLAFEAGQRYPLTVLASGDVWSNVIKQKLNPCQRVRLSFNRHPDNASLFLKGMSFTCIPDAKPVAQKPKRKARKAKGSLAPASAI